MHVPASTVAYLVLNIVAIVTNPLLLFTFVWAKSIRRHPTITNMLALWTLQSVSCCLLLFSGHISSDMPPTILCKLQSAAQYGAPSGTGAGAAAIVCRVWYRTLIVDRMQHPHKQKSIRIPPIIYLSLPYVLWLVVGIAAWFASEGNVRRFPRYCAANNVAPALISGLITGAILVVGCSLQIWAMFIVFTRYRVSKRVGLKETGQNVSVFLRVVAFSGMMLSAFVINFVAAGSWSSTVQDIILAAIGPGIFLTFGSQRDVLQAWGLRRPCAPPEESELATSLQPIPSVSAHAPTE